MQRAWFVPLTRTYLATSKLHGVMITKSCSNWVQWCPPGKVKVTVLDFEFMV